MTLEELTSKEDRLMRRVHQATGLIEEKHQQLEEAGVFEAYRQAHGEYARLAIEVGNLEALKRALFIQWYPMTEPACFTGIFETDLQKEHRVLEMLDRMVERAELDTELRWMLPWYYSIADFHFENQEGLRYLKEHLRREQSTLDRLWEEGTPSEHSLGGRGQMGYYWSSILGAYQKRSTPRQR